MREGLENLPKLAFGEGRAELRQDLNAYRDRLAEVVTGLRDLESVSHTPFLYKSCSVEINGLQLLASCRPSVQTRTDKPSQPIAGLMLSGRGSYVFEGKRHEFQPGNIMYVPEDVRSARIETSSTINLVLDRTRLCEAFQAIAGQPPDARQLLRLRRFQSGAALGAGGLIEHVSAIVSAIDLSLENPRALEVLGLDQVLYGLVAAAIWPELLEVRAAEGGMLDPRERATLSRLRDHIHANLGKPLQLTSLAILAGTSTRRVREMFLKGLGVTPADYIRDARLAQAKQLLEREPGKRIRDISAELGFTRASSFAAHYRQRFGEPPLTTRIRAEEKYLG